MKKLQLKAEYLLLEHSEVEELFADYSKIFNEDFVEEHAFLAAKAEAAGIVSQDSPDSDRKEDANADGKPTISEDLQKIYRLIAKKTHPDVCKVEEHRKLFGEAAAAYASGDWITLISISNTLRLTIPKLSRETIQLINESSEKWFEEIKSIKNRLPWVWVTVGQKDLLLRTKIRACMGINEQEFAEWKAANQITDK